MKPRAPLVALLSSLALTSATAIAAPDSDAPTVVELFQSQGCSSCPPANAVLNTLADRPDVLALSFAVTYWDYLGWKDRFAHPAYNARQSEYARAGGRTNVSTPQMIVNGRTVLIGHRRAGAEAAIARTRFAPGRPAISVASSRVSLAAGRPARPANVWLVRYDPRTQNVPIRAGENGGRTLPHRNIVREIYLVGKWDGSAASYAMPGAKSPLYRAAILIQDGPGGAILTARRI